MGVYLGSSKIALIQDYTILSNGLIDIINNPQKFVSAINNNSNITTIRSSFFRNLSNSINFGSIALPNCSYIGSYAFAYTNLTEISIKGLQTTGTYVFASCPNLSTVTLANTNNFTISNYTFYSCSNLYKLYLPDSNVVKLGASNAFSYTPMLSSDASGNFGSIYVPASLVTTYQATTNWTYLSSRITSI